MPADITRAVRTAIPPGVVLDGDLVMFERGRTNFAQLQRRVTAGRGLLRLARECPAHYVLFDLLADAGGEVILDLPLSERRARLEHLLVDAPAQLTLTPQTTDAQQVLDWLVNWPSRPGSRAWSPSGWAPGTSRAGAAGGSSGPGS